MRYIFHLLEELEDIERDWLDKNSRFSIHIARLVSLVCILFITYILTLLIPVLIGTVLEQFFSYSGAKYEYLWSISLLIAMPLCVPVFNNWLNKEYCFSSIVVDLYETIVFVKDSFRPAKSYIEIIGFLLYIILNYFLTLFAVANFVDEQRLIDYLESHIVSSFFVIVTVHTVIYIILRILLLPIKTIEQRYRKCLREFLLWFIVLVIGFCYMIYKLMNSFNSIDMFYLLGAILVAFVRFITSYRDLRKIIVELKETASFFM